MSKPSLSRRLYSSNPIAAKNIGTHIYKRLRMDFCSIPRKSATISRAERKAVSPLVMGAAITPSTANTPPTAPSQFFVMASTMTAALVSSIPFSWKKQVAAAAQISATMPSVIIAP